MNFQLALPDYHCRNISEKFIQTWKYHFIGVMSGTASTFLMHLWCQAIPKAECQLILLWKSKLDPAISAYAYMYGPHDYNAEPFVPIGMETLVHDKPRCRKTFAKYCSKGHVLGISSEQCHTWIMWMKEMKTTQISRTVFHKHNYITNPDVTPEYQVIAAMKRMF